MLESLTAKSAAADARLNAVLAEIPVAEKEADTRIVAALAAEKLAVAAAKQSTAASVGVAQAAATKALQVLADTAATAQATHLAAIAGMAVKERELSDSVVALEAKLDKLRAQAQKFAASLTAD